MMENPRYTISPEAIANGINDLLDEKEELQERIEKAIKYLKLFDENSTLIDHSIIKGALTILKGSDSNDKI